MLWLQANLVRARPAVDPLRCLLPLFPRHSFLAPTKLALQNTPAHKPAHTALCHEHHPTSRFRSPSTALLVAFACVQRSAKVLDPAASGSRSRHFILKLFPVPLPPLGLPEAQIPRGEFVASLFRCRARDIHSSRRIACRVFLQHHHERKTSKQPFRPPPAAGSGFCSLLLSPAPKTHMVVVSEADHERRGAQQLPRRSYHRISFFRLFPAACPPGRWRRRRARLRRRSRSGSASGARRVAEGGSRNARIRTGGNGYEAWDDEGFGRRLGDGEGSGRCVRSCWEVVYRSDLAQACVSAATFSLLCSNADSVHPSQAFLRR